MNDFDYECLQRKRLAHQAKYKKNGSKSKKCSLLSDRLTNKQWKERCGPVETYKLGESMKWDDFKNMPERLQVEYITRLQTKYGATAVDLAEMFGVGARSVRNYLSEHLPSVKLKRGKSMNAERRAEWMKFLGKDDAAVCDQTETDCNEAMQTEEVNQCNQESILDMSLSQSVEIPTESRSEPVDKDPSASNIEMKMTTLKMHFCGALDIDSIARRVKAVIGDNAVGELEIVCYMG